MHIKYFSTIDEFLTVVQPVLHNNEAANNMMLGVAQSVARDPQAYGTGYYCAAVYENDTLSAALLMTPPYHLLLHCAAQDCGEMWPAVIADLRQAGWPIPGVFGHSGPVKTFA
ncbi:MAG: hypothetical protein AAGU05_02285, partial [Anaerolineaceae bacterium]